MRAASSSWDIPSSARRCRTRRASSDIKTASLSMGMHRHGAKYGVDTPFQGQYNKKFTINQLLIGHFANNVDK